MHNLNFSVFKPYVENAILQKLADSLKLYIEDKTHHTKDLYLDILRNTFDTFSKISVTKDMKIVAKDYIYFEKIYRSLVAEYVKNTNSIRNKLWGIFSEREELIVKTYLDLIKLFLEEARVYGGKQEKKLHLLF